MQKAMWVIAIFGAVVILGGVIGYLQAQSLISLFAGTFFGIALLSSALAIMKGVNVAHYIALLIAVLLTAFFHWRYLRTGAFLPGGLMAIVSCLVSVWLLILRPKKQ